LDLPTGTQDLTIPGFNLLMRKTGGIQAFSRHNDDMDPLRTLDHAKILTPNLDHTYHAQQFIVYLRSEIEIQPNNSIAFLPKYNHKFNFTLSKLNAGH
jgi:hypothetical protein